jgi:hypothetical protein
MQGVHWFRAELPEAFAMMDAFHCTLTCIIEKSSAISGMPDRPMRGRAGNLPQPASLARFDGRPARSDSKSQVEQMAWQPIRDT